MAQVEGIELSRLERNELNPFTSEQDQERIDCLIDSIKENGIMQPLVVYPIPNNKYRVLLGHRRLEALKKIGNMSMKVPCKVVEKPNNETDEEQYILEGNISRNQDEDISILVERANYVWDSMNSGLRERYKKEYEADFKEKYGTRADYETYKKQNFRPRLEFIKRKTGMSHVTNRTVTNQLKKYVKGTSEEFISEPKAAKGIEFDDIKNRVVSLLGIIHRYEEGTPIISDTKKQLLADLANALDAFAS